jgi:hypothetical protein
VNQTELWLAQARDLLAECTRTKKLSSLGTLQDHFRRLDLQAALADLGCDLNCEGCSWGVPHPHPMQSACRLAAVQEAVLDMDTSDKRSASVVQETAALLEALRVSPKPAKR